MNLMSDNHHSPPHADQHKKEKKGEEKPQNKPVCLESREARKARRTGLLVIAIVVTAIVLAVSWDFFGWWAIATTVVTVTYFGFVMNERLVVPVISGTIFATGKSGVVETFWIDPVTQTLVLDALDKSWEKVRHFHDKRLQKECFDALTELYNKFDPSKNSSLHITHGLIYRIFGWQVISLWNPAVRIIPYDAGKGGEYYRLGLSMNHVIPGVEISGRDNVGTVTVSINVDLTEAFTLDLRHIFFIEENMSQEVIARIREAVRNMVSGLNADEVRRGEYNKPAVLEKALAVLIKAGIISGIQIQDHALEGEIAEAEAALAVSETSVLTARNEANSQIEAARGKRALAAAPGQGQALGMEAKFEVLERHKNLILEGGLDQRTTSAVIGEDMAQLPAGLLSLAQSNSPSGTDYLAASIVGGRPKEPASEPKGPPPVPPKK